MVSRCLPLLLCCVIWICLCCSVARAEGNEIESIEQLIAELEEMKGQLQDIEALLEQQIEKSLLSEKNLRDKYASENDPTTKSSLMAVYARQQELTLDLEDKLDEIREQIQALDKKLDIMRKHSLMGTDG